MLQCVVLNTGGPGWCERFTELDHKVFDGSNASRFLANGSHHCPNGEQKETDAAKKYRLALLGKMEETPKKQPQQPENQSGQVVTLAWYDCCWQRSMPYLHHQLIVDAVTPTVAAIMAETNRLTLILPERTGLS